MNQRGMAVVHDQVLNGPGWFIRDQVVSDFGIDAQVEVVDDDGDPTGRLLSLQVKSGPSWLRRPTKGGWRLPVMTWHCDYWLRHTLPVVVVLVDVEAKRAYWQLVDASTIERSGKGYRLFVPSTNMVSKAAEQWAHLAGEVTASAPGRWPEVLTHLPPAATRALRRLHASGAETSAAVLACHLADGRQDPVDTVQTLLRADPVWISDHGSRGWTALSAYAIEHGHLTLSGEALLRAVAGGTTHREPAADIADLLALAALRLSGDDRSRAQDAVEEALDRDPASPRAALVRSRLSQDLASAAPFSLPGDLDLTSARASADPVVQALLADDAHRRWETDREVRLRTQLWETNDQDGTASKLLAVALMRRAGTRNSQQDDELRARRLLESALAERHRWDGPTLDVLRPLLGLLLSQGDARAVLRLALPPPAGTATPAESRWEEVVRSAVQAARQLRDEPLARRLAEGLDGSASSLLLRAEVTGERLDPASEEQVLRGALQESLESDAAEALRLVLALAHRGVDASAELDDLVARSVISARHREFAAALALAHTDLDAGLPRLRQLARDDALVAETLVEVLAGADRAEEALAICEEAQRRFPHGPFTAQRAAVLGDAGRTAEAVEAARAALAEGVVTGIPAARLHHLLAQDAIDGRRWVEAERQLARAVQQQSPPPAGWVWNLITAVLHQYQPRRAVELLRRYRPVVRDVEDARAWMSAWQHLPLDTEAAEEALDLADRFLSDGELSASLLSTAVLVTRTSAETNVGIDDDTPSDGGQTEDADPRHVVPGELHRRAFAAMQAHSARHGDASPFRWRSGSSEELTEQALAMVRERYESTVEQARVAADAVQRVQRGEVPAGLLSAAVGHGYVEGLVQRDAGLFVAGSPVDHEHEAEVAAASEAAQVPVVVDASVLVLLAGLPHGQDLLARFPRVVTSTAVVADSVRAAGKLLHSLGTSLTLSWDSELQRPRALPDPPGRRARAAARAQVVAECAQGLPAEEVPLQSLRDALVGDLDDDESHGAPSDAQSEQADLRRDAPWLSALALARDRGWSLWCDDLALRRMARAHGVPAFGTPALLQAQVTAEFQRAEQVDEPASSQRLGAALEAYARDVRAMVADGVVDVPAGPDLLLEIAEGEGWTTGAASAVLARPLWWSDAEPALRDLRAVFVRLAEEPAADLLAWARTAMVGAARAYRGAPQGAATVIAAVCVLAEGCRTPDAVDDRGDSEDAVEAAQLANVAREVAEEHGLPDPAEVRDAAVRLMTGALD